MKLNNQKYRMYWPIVCVLKENYSYVNKQNVEEKQSWFKAYNTDIMDILWKCNLFYLNLQFYLILLLEGNHGNQAYLNYFHTYFVILTVLFQKFAKDLSGFCV